jgi:hypothetical protein
VRQLTTSQTEADRGSFPLDDLLHLANAEAVPVHRPIEPAIGTPEHAELVAAIQREFPEVYDAGSAGEKGKCP